MSEYWDGTGVTPEALEEEVRRLAAEQPDYVYDSKDFDDTRGGWSIPTCRYTHIQDDGAKVPGCIIGKAIYNLTGKLVNQQGSGIGGVLDFGFMKPERDESFEWTSRARFLGKVQNMQDEGYPWGHAVQRASELYPTS